MLLDILFPPKCCFCGKIEKKYLCKKCEIQLNKLKKDKIEKKKNDYFDYHLYGYEYKDEIRNQLLSLKFNDKPEISKTFANLLLNNKKICGFLKKYDIIIPVPMYRKKQILRGYNQSGEIAKIIGKNLNIEYCEDVLFKTSETKTQSNLNAKERKLNVKNAYMCKNMQKIKEKSVVLFDDIYTTGSTARECSKMLKIAGANTIAVFTLAND